MKLHELPRGSLFTVDSGELLHTDKEPVYRLDHLDGMYSVCYDMSKKLVHWSVVTPVKVVEQK